MQQVDQQVECIVIGAGVIGLACARALALKNIEVVILEAQSTIGNETSSRNSEVIHAGIYYPTNSLKAKLCLAGKQALYSYCVEHNIKHKKIGKLIVATDQHEVAKLANIQAQAHANGVNLQWLSSSEVLALEPELTAVAAGLFSDTTGIIDSHGLMHALLGEAEKHGAMLAVNSEVISVAISDNCFLVTVKTLDTIITTATKYLLNSAGLTAHLLAQNIQGYDQRYTPKLKYCKGNYFVLPGKSPFNHLVYPIPAENGLGIHSTLDLAGSTRFGPDTEWITAIDYKVNEQSKEKFINSIARYWPQIRVRELHPGYVGIRPKASLAESSGDFIILDQQQHGIPGLVQLFGIESPGLTACLSLADMVCDKILR